MFTRAKWFGQQVNVAPLNEWLDCKQAHEANVSKSDFCPTSAETLGDLYSISWLFFFFFRAEAEAGLKGEEAYCI